MGRADRIEGENSSDLMREAQGVSEAPRPQGGASRQ
jgi:hypothetical protein